MVSSQLRRHARRLVRPVWPPALFSNGDEASRPQPDGFTCWLTGAGVKPGVSHAETEEPGQKAIEGIHLLHDFDATVLQLAGLDHERVTFEHNGIQRLQPNGEACDP